MKISKYNVLLKEKCGTAVLYNTGSSAILSLNQEYTDKYERFCITGECSDNEMVNNLEKGGFLVNDEIDEVDSLLTMNKISRFSDSSLSLTIAPTLACNFKCPYCYEKGKKYSTISDETITNFVGFFEDTLRHVHDVGVSWYGGEPLLALEQIERITDIIKSKISSECEYSCDMVTNGYLLSREIAERLKKLDIKFLQVTLDGAKNAHNKRRILHNDAPTFEIILKNISDCIDIIPIVVRINVDKNNMDSASEIFDWFDEYGLKGIPYYLAPVDSANDPCNSEQCLLSQEYAKEEIEFYLKGFERGYYYSGFDRNNYGVCGAVAWNSYVVDPVGNLYKCWNDIGYPERRVGNVNEKFVINKSLAEWLNYNPMRDEECKECKIFPICFGGCAYSRNEKKCNSLRWNIDDMVKLITRQKSEAV